MSDEIAKLESPSGPSAAIAVFGPGAVAYTGLDRTKPEDRKILAQCIGGFGPRLADSIGQQIKLSNVYAKPGEFQSDETGEVEHGVITVLIDSDGSTYQCASKGIARCISGIIGVYGAPPWNPPLLVQVNQHALQGARRMFALAILDDNLTTHHKKTK